MIQVSMGNRSRSPLSPLSFRMILRADLITAPSFCAVVRGVAADDFRGIFGQDLQDGGIRAGRSSGYPAHPVILSVFWFISPVFAFELEALGAEVEKEADFDAGCGEIIHELGFVRGSEIDHGFVFDEHNLLGDHVRDEVSDANRPVSDLDRPRQSGNPGGGEECNQPAWAPSFDSSLRLEQFARR